MFSTGSDGFRIHVRARGTLRAWLRRKRVANGE